MASDVHVDESVSNRYSVGVLLAVLISPIALLVYLAFREPPDLALCDKAIQADLRSPSTYKRVSVDGSAGVYKISYDAANAYGTPIRSKGQCFADGREAHWFEEARPDDL